MRLNLNITIVQLLKNKCLFDSINRAFIKFHRLDIFFIVLNVNQRRAIFTRIMLFKTIISFIFTFFENTKYLELCVKILKTLISKSIKKTLHQNFQNLHNDQKTYFMQQTKEKSKKKIEVFIESIH